MKEIQKWGRDEKKSEGKHSLKTILKSIISIVSFRYSNKKLGVQINDCHILLSALQ